MDCGTSCSATPTLVKCSKGYGHIDTNGLETLIAAEVPVVILDARGGKWDDKKRIAHATSLTYEATAEEAESAIPCKKSLIVVYCSNTQCPASHALAKRLTELGYAHILEYAEGIQEWMNCGYPVKEAK